MVQFETGKTYATRSVCDANCIISLTVIKRTAKTITAKNITGFESDVKTFRISEWNGVEQVRPWGKYSMAPIIGAN